MLLLLLVVMRVRIVCKRGYYGTYEVGKDKILALTAGAGLPKEDLEMTFIMRLLAILYARPSNRRREGC